MILPDLFFKIYFQYYCKYKFKSRSDNEPHIFAIADGAYQDMLHHDVPQHIVITGETMSGKTRQFNHIIKHLLFLGRVSQKFTCGMVKLILITIILFSTY